MSDTSNTCIRIYTYIRRYTVTITSEKARYVYLFDLYVIRELMSVGLKSLLEDAIH